MSLKLITITLFALSLLQGLADAKHIGDVYEPSMFEDIGKVAAEIREAIQESITSFQGVSDEVRKHAEEEMNNGLVEIQHHEDRVAVEIQAMQKWAQAQDRNVEECVQEQAPRIKAAVRKAREEIMNCLSDVIENIFVLYSHLLEISRESYEHLNALLAESDECEDVECRQHVFMKLLSLMIKVSLQVRTVVVESIHQMRDHLPEARKCTRAALKEYRTEMQDIIADIQKCAEGEEESGENQIVPKNIMDDISQLIEKMNDAISDIIFAGVESIKAAYENVLALASKLTTKFEEKIKGLVDKLRKDIDEFKKNAHDLGVDISECLDQVEPKVDDLNKEVGAEFRKCNEIVVNSAKKIYENILFVRDDIVSEFHSLVAKFKECSDFECRVKVLRGFGKLSFRIAIETKDLIVKSIRELGGSAGDLAKCTTRNGLNFAKGIKAIRQEFQQCFDAKRATF